MNDQFYIVLSSNSSIKYYPENTATRFITQLPQQIQLQGKWSIALTEIHVPQTFQHLPLKPEKDRIVVVSTKNKEASEKKTSVATYASFLHPGVFNDLSSLIEEVNELSCLKNHLKFRIERGGYVSVHRICTDCENVYHIIELPGLVGKIFGFQQHTHPISITIYDQPAVGILPANLSNSLPNTIMIYCDLCEPYFTSDVESRLLRSLTLDLDKFYYGNIRIKNFSPPMYLPILINSFQTIEIDLRDQHGKPISFDFGTLTVVLHFKQVE